METGVGLEKNPVNGRSLFTVGITADQREGVSTVNLNHPLAANSTEAGELCGNFNMYS